MFVRQIVFETLFMAVDTRTRKHDRIDFDHTLHSAEYRHDSLEELSLYDFTSFQLSKEVVTISKDHIASS
jgi:hypothetical protein